MYDHDSTTPMLIKSPNSCDDRHDCETDKGYKYSYAVALSQSFIYYKQHLVLDRTSSILCLNRLESIRSSSLVYNAT